MKYKKCAICSMRFKPKKWAKIFETRQLCEKCRDAIKKIMKKLNIRELNG